MKTDNLIKLIHDVKENGINPISDIKKSNIYCYNNFTLLLNSKGKSSLDKILLSIKNELDKLGYINIKNLEKYFLNECMILFSEDNFDHQTIENKLNEFISKLKEILVKEHTIIIPITGLKVKKNFDILNYQIVSKTAFHREYKKFFEKDRIIGTSYSKYVDVGDSYAITKNAGDPNSIGNKQIEELDSALNLVRLYIPTFWHHDYDVQISIVNKEFVTINSFFVLDNLQLRNFSSSIDRRPLKFEIDKKRSNFSRYSQRKHMELLNFKDLNETLMKNNALSRIIENSLSWIGLYTRIKNTKLKFLYLIFALENIFSNENNNYSSITAAVSEKTAFIVESNSRDRRKIFDFVKAMYDKRSAIVHGSAQMVDNNDLISLYDVYLTCISKLAKLILKHNLKTKNDLNNYISEMKFS